MNTKINVWKCLVTNDRFEMFSPTNDFVTENNSDCNVIKTIIIDHLKSLEEPFKKYFQTDINSHFDWVQKPFNESIQNITHLPVKVQEEFAEFSSDTNLELAQTNLNSFWIKVKGGFPILSDLAIKMLLSFATTYLCESAFSTLVAITY
ncbi:SCAN domain-containing protein 3-like [Haematobia irritans]|uniref:SCAN domain-containing protein 3-like n=1 Tax=Haematobia irritans TaxID=7368 RepID=UPI003F50CA2B